MVGTGRGVEADPVAALVWFRLAKSRVDEELRQKTLRRIAELEMERSEDELAEVEKRVEAWRPTGDVDDTAER